MGWTALLLITSRLLIHKRFNSVQPLQHPLLRSCWKRGAVNFSDRPSSMSFLERQQLLQQEVWAQDPHRGFTFRAKNLSHRENSSFIRPWLQVSLSISAVFIVNVRVWHEQKEKVRKWECYSYDNVSSHLFWFGGSVLLQTPVFSVS